VGIYGRIPTYIWNTRPTTVPKVHGLPHFKIIRSLVLYCTVEINTIDLNPWAWLRNGVDDLNSNMREVLHEGVYQTIDESMSPN
jgi:hypothetical protein